MKKKLVIGTIGLVAIGVMFANTEEEVIETTNAETEEVSDNSKTEMTDKEKSELQKQNEEEKAEKEKAEKERAEKEKAEKQKAEEEKAKAEEAKAEEKAKAEEAKAEEEKAKAEEAAAKEDNEEIYLQVMRESIGGYVDIQFQKAEKNFKLTPTDAGLIDEISMLPLGVGHDDWAVLVNGMTEMSKSGKELVGEGYSISLINPLNHENVILWIMDGEVIYNVIDDL